MEQVYLYQNNAWRKAELLASVDMTVKKLIRSFMFRFDYYIGYFLTNAHKHDVYREYMFNEYPEYFQNELRFLKEKEDARLKSEEQVLGVSATA